MRDSECRSVPGPARVQRQHRAAGPAAGRAQRDQKCSCRFGSLSMKNRWRLLYGTTFLMHDYKPEMSAANVCK